MNITGSNSDENYTVQPKNEYTSLQSIFNMFLYHNLYRYFESSQISWTYQWEGWKYVNK